MNWAITSALILTVKSVQHHPLNFKDLSEIWGFSLCFFWDWDVCVNVYLLSDWKRKSHHFPHYLLQELSVRSSQWESKQEVKQTGGHLCGQNSRPARGHSGPWWGWSEPSWRPFKRPEMLLRDQEGCVWRACVWGGGDPLRFFTQETSSVKPAWSWGLPARWSSWSRYWRSCVIWFPPPVTHLVTGWSTDTAESRCSRFIQRFHFTANSSACFEKSICEATKGRRRSPEAPTVNKLTEGEKKKASAPPADLSNAATPAPRLNRLVSHTGKD